MDETIIRKKGIYTQNHQVPRKIKISARFFIILFWVIIMAVLLYIFLFSHYFDIKIVLVEGAKTTESQISKIIERETEKRPNLFLFPKADTEKNIKENILEISEIKIFRGIPNALKVKVKEREKKMIWKTASELYYVDQDGYIFGKAKGDENIPIISDESGIDINLGQRVASEEFVKFGENISANFQNKTKQDITRLYITESLFDLKVATNKNIYVIFDTSYDYNIQLELISTYYPKIQNEVREYIDLRIRNKIYYK